jgi:hypothetical protein
MHNFLLVCYIFLSLTSFAQSKGDNAIVIKDSAVNLISIKQEWLRQGFLIDKNDSTYLTTEVLQQKGWYGVKFSAMQDADSIVLRGWVRADITLAGARSSGLIIADYKGMKGSANRETFTELYHFAQKLSPSSRSIKQ